VALERFVANPSGADVAGLLLNQFSGPAGIEAPSAAGSIESPATLVPIQTSGGRPPFFCVTAGYGDILALADLARHLGPDQPFYGLQPPEREAAASLDALVTEYMAEMRRIQPRGAYRLGGYCSGGLVAFEMARRLLQQGESVSCLALMEAPFTVSAADHMIFHSVRRLLGPHLPAEQLRQQPLAMTILQLLFKDDGLVRHLDALTGYVPSAYPGRITFFQAEQSYTRIFPIPAQWRRVARGGLDIQRVPGDHGTFMRGANVPAFAQRLRSLL
jgi:thioesterase domain-containing protein